MDLDKFGDKYGDAILQGVKGGLTGINIHNQWEDRQRRMAEEDDLRERRSVMRAREDEAYEHEMSRRGMVDETQDMQFALTKMDFENKQDIDKFRKTVRKDAVEALRGLQSGNVSVVNDFYNKHIKDGKTGSFIKNKDGSYRHEFKDDITGEYGTELFSEDDMQTILVRASQTDDEFLANLMAMRDVTAKRKADAAVADQLTKDKIKIEREKSKSKGSDKPSEVILKNGQKVKESDLRGRYNSQYGKFDPMGQFIGLMEDAPRYEEFFNNLVRPEYRIKYEPPGGLTQQDKPLSKEELDRARVELNTAEGGDKASDLIPFNEPSENEVKKRAYENRGMTGQTGLTGQGGQSGQTDQGDNKAGGKVVRDNNIARALDAIKAGKDPARVKQRLLDNGYTEDQLRNYGI